MIKKIAISLLLLSSLSNAKDLLNTADVKIFTKTVIKSISKGQVKKGVESLVSKMDVSKDKSNKMISSLELDKKTAYQEKTYGKNLGFEHISTKKVGKSILKITYIQKLEKHAITWTFLYYKPSRKWYLNTFNFSDNMNIAVSSI